MSDHRKPAGAAVGMLALILFVILSALLSGGCGKSKEPRAISRTNSIVSNKKSFDDTLSRIAKQNIDDWITTNKLNEYGDAPGTMYVGGTPLFDETTGRQLTRYEYLARNHPDLFTNGLANTPLLRTNASGTMQPTNRGTLQAPTTVEPDTNKVPSKQSPPDK